VQQQPGRENASLGARTVAGSLNRAGGLKSVCLYAYCRHPNPTSTLSWCGKTAKKHKGTPQKFHGFQCKVVNFPVSLHSFSENRTARRAGNPKTGALSVKNRAEPSSLNLNLIFFQLQYSCQAPLLQLTLFHEAPVAHMQTLSLPSSTPTYRLTSGTVQPRADAPTRDSRRGTAHRRDVASHPCRRRATVDSWRAGDTTSTNRYVECEILNPKPGNPKPLTPKPW
jgi:hypothetical protein